MGGNSIKANGGISGALTQNQTEQEIEDSVQQFYDDTIRSAGDRARPKLISVLTSQSAAALRWLEDVFNLVLDHVSQVGYA